LPEFENISINSQLLQDKKSKWHKSKRVHNFKIPLIKIKLKRIYTSGLFSNESRKLAFTGIKAKKTLLRTRLVVILVKGETILFK